MTCLDPGTIVVCEKTAGNLKFGQSQMCDGFCGYLPTITGGGLRRVRDDSNSSVATPLPPLR